MTAATLQSIAVTPANPSDRRGGDAAVHGDRHVQRQHDAEPDESGDLGVGDAGGRDDHRGGPGDSGGGGHVDDQRDAGRRDGLDGADGDGRDAAVDRGDAGESVASPQGATQQFTATGTFSDNSTQNLTSQVTWASATPASATITAAGLATAVAAGTSTISATLSGVTGSTIADGDGGDACSRSR